MDPKVLTYICMVVLILACLPSIVIVSADIPSVLEITREKEGDDTILKLVIRHGSPSRDHYVDIIEVDVDGEVQSFSVTEPQTSNTFTHRVNLGDLEPSNIKVKAHCNIHGWSARASEKEEEGGGGGIPGFPYESVILGALFGVLLLWMLQRRTVAS